MSDITAPAARRPDGVAVRAARVSDFEGVAAISAMPGFRHGTLRLPFRSPDETRRFLEGIGSDDLLLVAERDGAVLGTAGWRRAGGRRAHVAEIGMGVHDGHAGRGIGSALLAALVDAADRWYGVRRLALGVYTDNARAIALYRRFGFAEEGIARGDAFRDGRYVDVLHMARIGPVG
ncbi:GNAT family N-acetyltransferase [Lichenibacterium minor]|uniref:GNAT family N-acetyltransferase n=1 Tax=Lichenibacterium minor TaxID=2316528 RepID=A0A4V1RUY9_9HYPH|nr:GNAT family N-acetyltransferase [Lichenibacterium minor]RYC32814.1 GNAT family N-acetyltransferase [Lichenibacterium minor]